LKNIIRKFTIKTIRISEKVYGEIAKRGKFGETPNDVLERVFHIERTIENIKSNKRASLPPNGTNCRMKLKGKYIYGKINYGRLCTDDGREYSSFSKAASDIRGVSLNGWYYWEIRNPFDQNEWISADNWRKRDEFRTNNSKINENRKMRWFEATLKAVKRYCEKHDTKRFKLKELLKEELDNIITDTKTQGKTPDYTLQYYLQKLRDADYIEFLDNQGTYLLKQHNLNITLCRHHEI